MENKFTRAMLCEEFGSKCRECPLFCDNNFKSLPCWLLDESVIQDIMKDYPYVGVKVRMIFNDIETRLTAVEKKVENNVSVEFKPERVVFGCSYNRDIGFSSEVVDKKLYDKLEAKHEADCRLISEYDLEIKRLEDKCGYLEKENRTFNVLLINKTETIGKLGCEYDKLKNEVCDLEEERDHYKGLYSSECYDYDALLENKIKNEKSSMEEVAKYKNLFHSLNHKHQKVVGEMRHWKERAMEAERKLEKLEKPEKLRTALERENAALRETLESVTKDHDKINSDYYIAQENLKITNEKLKKTEKKIKHAEEVGDNYKLLYDTTCGNYDKLEEKYNKLLKDYKLLSESNNNHAKDNVKLEGELEAKTNRIAALEEKLRNQRTNLASLQEKYEDAREMNKMREGVFESNLKLKKAIEAKDREIDLLRAELDKYKTDDEFDDRWID